MSLSSKKLPDLPTSSISAPTAAGGPPILLPESAPLTAGRKAWVENLTIVLQHKRLILAVMLLVTIAVGIYAFIWMPNYYKAYAVILPARKAGGELDNITSGLASSLKDLGVAKLHGGGETYTALSLMNSRELQEKLVRRFGFIQIYRDKNIEEALKDFSTNLDGELSEEGAFTISFEDTSPARAAAVTNAIVESINEVNSRLEIEEAKNNLTYAQMRNQQNLADLDSAEHVLGAFQRQYGVYSLPEQAKAELTALGELEQQKYMAEIQLQNAEQLYGSNASEVAVYRSTIDQLAGKLGEMRAGMDAKATSFVPTNVMPDVALQYLRDMREVEIQSKLKAFLLPAYEQAKLDQEKLLYGFVTLDHAEPPIKKSRPHRSIFLLAAIFGSTIITSIFVVLTAHFRRFRMNFIRDQQRIRL